MNASVPMLRNSERSTFKRCQQKWWWSYREGLVPGTQATPLWFGTGIHLALAEWYLPGLNEKGLPNRGPHPAETWEKFCKENYESVVTTNADGEKEFVDAKELGTIMMENYIQVYGQDETWNIIAPEQRFQVLIPHPQNKRQPIIDLRGTFDGVYQDMVDGRYKLMDHKTAASISTGHLPMDEQAGTYVAVAQHSLRKDGLIPKNARISGITYNFLRKGKPDNRPRDERGVYHNKPTAAHYKAALTAAGYRTLPGTDVSVKDAPAATTVRFGADLVESGKLPEVFGDVSKNQGTPLLVREWVARTSKESRRQILRIGEEAMQMNMFRDGNLPLSKNPTKDCQWDCPYREMCLLDERGGDTEEFKAAMFRAVDPYADHRDGAVNSKTSLDDRKESHING